MCLFIAVNIFSFLHGEGLFYDDLESMASACLDMVLAFGGRNFIGSHKIDKNTLYDSTLLRILLSLL
jgi:hypothetical protein